MTVAHAIPHRFTVDDYHRMAADGILAPGQRVELIQGEVVEMTPIGSRHAAVVNQLNRLLGRAVGDRAIVSVQNPIRLSIHDEPEPDLALLKPRRDGYSEALPSPGDALLVIEVADTSLRYDLDSKLPLYARAGTPEAWLVDLVNNVIERHTSPGDEGYRTRDVAGVGGALTSETLPDLCLDVDTALLLTT